MTGISVNTEVAPSADAAGGAQCGAAPEDAETQQLKVIYMNFYHNTIYCIFGLFSFQNELAKISMCKIVEFCNIIIYKF